MLIERVVGELAQRDHVARLVPGANHQRGRVAGARWRAGWGAAALRLWRCPSRPSLVSVMLPKWTPLATSSLVSPCFTRAADALQVGGHLAGQHLQVAGAEHAGGGAQIADVLQGARLAFLAGGALGGLLVVAVERDEIEALREHEDVGDEIAAAAGNSIGRRCGSRCRNWHRDADTRLNARNPRRGCEGSARACPVPLVSGRPPPSSVSPVGVEQFLAVGQDLGDGVLELLVILPVARNGRLRGRSAIGRRAACRDASKPHAKIVEIHLVVIHTYLLGGGTGAVKPIWRICCCPRVPPCRMPAPTAITAPWRRTVTLIPPAGIPVIRKFPLASVLVLRTQFTLPEDRTVTSALARSAAAQRWRPVAPGSGAASPAGHDVALRRIRRQDRPDVVSAARLRREHEERIVDIERAGRVEILVDRGARVDVDVGLGG